MSLSFRTNGNFIDFVNTDATSLEVETVLMKLHNTSRCIDWSLPEDTTKISFTIDEVKYSNIPITEIDFDGTVMNSQDDFETGITEMFPGLSGSPSSGGGVESKTYAELVALINASGLTAGTTYKITNRGDRGLFFQAISTTQLAKDGTRLMLCPANYFVEVDGSGNSWKGVWNINKDVDADDLMIWGGKVWKNLTGAIGTADDDTALDETNWDLIPKASFSNNEYVEKIFGVNYDITNDWIEKQWDAAGNVFGIDFYSEDNEYDFGFNLCDVSDWNYATSFDTFAKNTCLGVYNNAKNTQNSTSIVNNSNKGVIGNNYNTRNIRNNYNAGDIYNNSGQAQIIENGNAGDIIDNTNTNKISGNMNSGKIEGNSNTGEIYCNRCANVLNNSNTGNISENANGGDLYDNSNTGSIFDNTNTGNIGANSNGGDIFHNKNAGGILNNANDGYISLNGNNGDISGNTNVGNIEKNSNVGNISTCSSGTDPCNIFNNINNGSISGVFAADVNDTVVDKT